MNRLMFPIIVWFLLGLALFQGCSKDRIADPPSTLSDSTYHSDTSHIVDTTHGVEVIPVIPHFEGIPDTSYSLSLKVGNEWVWEENWSELRITYDTLRITGEVVIDGERWFNTNRTYYLANRAGGLYSRDKNKLDSILLKIKYPVSSGDTNNIVDWYQMNNGQRGYLMHSNWIVTATGQMIDVPAGKFKCWKATEFPIYDDGTPYRPAQPEMENNYYSPGIGRVRYEQLITTGANGKILRTSHQLNLVSVILK